MIYITISKLKYLFLAAILHAAIQSSAGGNTRYIDLGLAKIDPRPAGRLAHIFADRYILDEHVLSQASEHCRQADSAVYYIDFDFGSSSEVSFYFDPYILPQGYKFSIQPQDTGEPARFFGQRPNTSLPTLPFSGGRFRFTVTAPIGADSAFSIKLHSAGVTAAMAKTQLKSTNCRIDVSCPEFSDIYFLEPAVCKIVIDNRSNCTGTLINNTASDGKLYVLTANHCISTAAQASNSIFMFGYSKAECSAGAKEPLKFAGAKLVATSPDNSLDFALLELYDEAPIGASLFYSGWTVKTDLQGPVWSLHHPRGDYMKGSKSDAAPIQEWFTDPSIGYSFVSNSHWRVQEWSAGVTERGSSGAGLFNAAGQITGVLSGGDAACGYPYDDFYQMLSYAWDYFPKAENQLKHWLDPRQTGVKELGSSGSALQCHATGGAYSLIGLPDCPGDGYVFGSGCQGEGAEFGSVFSPLMDYVSGLSFYVGENSLGPEQEIGLHFYNAYGSSYHPIDSFYVAAGLLTAGKKLALGFPRSVETAGDILLSIKVPESGSGRFALLSQNSLAFADELRRKNAGKWETSQDIAMKTSLPICLWQCQAAYSRSGEVSVEAFGVNVPYSSGYYTIDSVTVSPNPAYGGKVTVEFCGMIDRNIKFSLFSIQGRAIYEKLTLKSIGRSVIELDLAGVPPGLYFLHIEKNGRRIVRALSVI
jgi:hypothetical protein